MDVDFWAARVLGHSSSVQSARRSDSGNHIFAEDEGGDEVKAWFPCPLCNVDIELPLLCVHLQEEHCFDLKNAVCPICATKLGKDPLDHLKIQHAHSIKRKKSEKSGLWSNFPGYIIKDLRDLSSFLSADPLASQGSGNEPPQDHLLSLFLHNVPLTPPKGTQEPVSSCFIAASDDESRKLSPSDEVAEEDFEEKMQHALFIKELLLSTIF